MVLRILKWFLRGFLLCGLGYYGLGKFLKWQSPFISLLDEILKFIGYAFNFIANHILAIVIVLGFIGFIWCLYYYITTRHNNKF